MVIFIGTKIHTQVLLDSFGMPSLFTLAFRYVLCISLSQALESILAQRMDDLRDSKSMTTHAQLYVWFYSGLKCPNFLVIQLLISYLENKS